MWAYSNFDRIAAEAIKRQEKPSYDDFFKNVEIGTVLKIRLPRDYSLTGTKSLSRN